MIRFHVLLDSSRVYYLICVFNRMSKNFARLPHSLKTLFSNSLIGTYLLYFGVTYLYQLMCTLFNSPYQLLCTLFNSPYQLMCTLFKSLYQLLCTLFNSLYQLMCTLFNSPYQLMCNLFNSPYQLMCTLFNSPYQCMCTWFSSPYQCMCTSSSCVSIASEAYKHFTNLTTVLFIVHKWWYFLR